MCCITPPCSLYISIHALRGEGDNAKRGGRLRRGISIHALRGEGDVNLSRTQEKAEVFQSTPSVGRATFAWYIFI